MNSIPQLESERATNLEQFVTDAIAALHEADRSLYAAERKDEALEKLREAARIVPNVIGIDFAIRDLEWDLPGGFGPSFGELVQKALHLFGEAVKLVPDDPWLWFQIGLLNYNAYFTRDANAATEALERALELDPANIHVQLALAYVLEHFPGAMVTIDVDPIIESLSVMLEDESLPNHEAIRSLKSQLETNRDDETHTLGVQASRTGSGSVRVLVDPHARAQQLLAATDWKDHLQDTIHNPGSHFLAPQLEVTYYPSSLSYDAFLENIEVLGQLVDESEQMEYFLCLIIGTYEYGPDSERVLHWCDLGQRSPGRPDHAFSLHLYNAEFLARVDYIKAIDHFQRAFDLIRVQDDPVQALWWWLDELSRSMYFNEWLPDKDEIDLFLQLMNTALDTTSIYFQQLSPVRGTDSPLADIAEMAARALLSHGRSQEAAHYLEMATGFAPERSNLWRELADLHLDAHRWQAALTAYREVARLEPADPEVLRQIALLENAITGVQDRQTLDAILSNVIELRTGQDLILEEVSLQRTLLQRAEQAQRQAATAFQRREDDESAVQALVDQLDRLLQEASKIQPVAWRAAEERVSIDLGSDVDAGLLRVSRHFLLTAEVFYHAGLSVAGYVDAALVSVEFSKVVETELRCRILKELGKRLDNSGNKGYRGRLDGNGEIRRDGKPWQSTLSSLMLGDGQQLLARAAAGTDNAVVMEQVRSVGFDEAWLKVLADDLKTVSTVYRNGAAHIKRLNWSDLEAFRGLLYHDRLLARLIKLGSALEQS